MHFLFVLFSNLRPAALPESKNEEESTLFFNFNNLDLAFVSLFFSWKLWYCDIYLVRGKYLFLQFISKDPLVPFMNNWCLDSRKIHLILCIFLIGVLCSNGGFFNESIWGLSKNFIGSPGCKTYVSGHRFWMGVLTRKKERYVSKDCWRSSQKTIRFSTYHTWHRKYFNRSERCSFWNYVLFWSFFTIESEESSAKSSCRI